MNARNGKLFIKIVDVNMNELFRIVKHKNY